MYFVRSVKYQKITKLAETRHQAHEVSDSKKKNITYNV